MTSGFLDVRSTRAGTQLRARDPGKDDRALLEELARAKLGFDALRESQRRNAVDEDEAMAQAVKAVREIRAGRA